ncbi:sporulation delaying protein family toxin [Streptomyces sp. TM32]|uniref:sporulation delaying protein family toxin n=1 Tax=Streptomyces sp. TM32 TaxID=1652669 RepID=UPI0010131CD9|nr:sporulation delaying protein family toxin [Streptomyces sp. TM32]RXS83685.1 sporulation delaying protein family toxin [Streptomyces sp. TM32]
MLRRTSVAIAAVTALAVSGVAVQGAMATPPAPRTHSAEALAGVGTVKDGRALFEGLAFAQGTVAEELGKSGKFVDIAALRTKNSTPEQRKAATALLNAIQKQHPKFFSSFSAKLRSGDPRKVESATTEAGRILKSLATKSSAAVADAGTGSGMCATVVLAINVLVAVNLGGVANVSVALNVQAWRAAVNTVDFWSSPPSGSSSLSRDQEIALLTKTLAA